MKGGGLGMKKKTFYATPSASKKSLQETREIVRRQKYDADRISLDLTLLVRPPDEDDPFSQHAVALPGAIVVNKRYKHVRERFRRVNADLQWQRGLPVAEKLSAKALKKQLKADAAFVPPALPPKPQVGSAVRPNAMLLKGEWPGPTLLTALGAFYGVLPAYQKPIAAALQAALHAPLPGGSRGPWRMYAYCAEPIDLDTQTPQKKGKKGGKKKGFDLYGRPLKGDNSPTVAGPKRASDLESTFRGVDWSNEEQAWEAAIRDPTGARVVLGHFAWEDEMEAARAFDKAARALRGNMAAGTLNFPQLRDEDPTPKPSGDKAAEAPPVFLFYNKITNLSTFDHPADAYFRRQCGKQVLDSFASRFNCILLARVAFRSWKNLTRRNTARRLRSRIFAKIYRMRTMRLARTICVKWHEWAAYQKEKRDRLRCALAHFNEHACQVTFNLWRYRVFVDAKIQKHLMRQWFTRLHAASKAGSARARVKTEKLCREINEARRATAALGARLRAGVNVAGDNLRRKLWKAEMEEARLLDGHFTELTTPGDPAAAEADAAATAAPTEEDRRLAVASKMETLAAMQDTLARLEGRTARARTKLAALDARVARAAAGEREKAAARRANKTRRARAARKNDRR